MSATSSYTITYELVGPLGSNPVDINVYYKENGTNTYILATTNVNAVTGQTFTYTFGPLPSHTVYQVKIESVCDGNTVQLGDYQYLKNPVCQPITLTPIGGTIDVEWECFTLATGDSVLEYRIEYKEVGSPGPYYIETIPIADVTTYWSNNPGSYPNFIYNISTGIVGGLQYEVNLYTTLQFDYILEPNPTPVPAQVLVGPCTETSTVVVNFEMFEDGNVGLQENNDTSILEN